FLLLPVGGLHQVHRFPIHIESPRYPILLHPHPERVGHAPSRFLQGERRQARAGGVVHHVDQTTSRPPCLQPILEAPVHLYQLAKVSPSATAAAGTASSSAPASTIPRPASNAA